MKKTRKNYLVIALVVVLIALAVGYAAFSTNLMITGTATGTGTWDVKFISATISNASYGTATVTNDTTITVAVELAYPGDGCTVTANIKNNGNIPAKLTGFNVTQTDGTTAFSDENITVTIPTIATDGTEVIQPGETCPVTIAIQWKEESEAQAVDAAFKVNFTYEQNQETVTVTPAHGTH